MNFFGVATCAVVLVGLTSLSCNRNKDDDNEETVFNKQAMLYNIGKNVILPSYEDLDHSIAELYEGVKAFESAKTQENLDAVKSSFIQAYHDWQACSPYEFGPAAEVGLRLAVNTFPVDTAQIESNISEGSYSLTTAQNSDAKGLPALDYLLFGHTLENFDNARVDYLVKNVEFVKNLVSEVTSAWQGGYVTTFADNTGSDVGSSLGQLVNELNFDYELIKNAKIGIPLGKKTLEVIQPEKVEAKFSGQSKALALANLSAIRETINGGSGLGIDDYLDALDATYSGQELSEAIQDGFAEAESKINAIEGNLYDAIINNPSQVEAAYVAIQELVVLLKTDMPSQLGVQITYQDNDGD